MKQRIESDDLEDKVEKNTQAEQQKEKRILKSEAEQHHHEQRIKNLFEKIITKKFPNMVKEKNTQAWEAQRVPNKLEPKRRH